MKLVDANILLNAVNESAADRGRSRGWLDQSLSGSAPVGFAWNAMLAFVRVSTHPRLFDRPLTISQATGQVSAWLGAASAYVLQPTAGHADVLSRLLLEVGTGGNLTNDAHLAALSIEHRATVVTLDRDFARFPGVRWELPR